MTSPLKPASILPTLNATEPLAAAGHVVVMPLDGNGFAHEHAEVEDERGNPVFALPGQRFGPELDLHADFPRPGLYRLWGQFRTTGGEVITTTFTLRPGDAGAGSLLTVARVLSRIGARPAPLMRVHADCYAPRKRSGTGRRRRPRRDPHTTSQS
jgi:hypothetical protein